MRSLSLPLQQAGHIAAVRTVERHAGNAGHVFAHPLERTDMVLGLEHELGLVAFEIDPVEVSNCHDLDLDGLDLRAYHLGGAHLRDVTERILPLASDRNGVQERQKDSAELQFSAHRAFSSFDLDGQDGRFSRSLQGWPRRPLDASGRDLHVGPITDATTHHLPPFADEALSARIQRLTGPEARAAERSDLATIAIALTACLFIATLAGSAFVGAAMRLPAIEQRLAEQARI